MKAMLAENNNKPLWSTIVASPANKTNSPHTQLQVEIAKRERLEQGRHERAKTAVTLTFRDADEDTCMAPKNANESEYTFNLQQAIDKTSAKGTTIRKLQKLLGKLLKIHCDNGDSAQ